MKLIQLFQRHKEPDLEEEGEVTSTDVSEDIKNQEQERRELREVQRILRQQLDLIKQSKGIL